MQQVQGEATALLIAVLSGGQGIVLEYVVRMFALEPSRFRSIAHLSEALWQEIQLSIQSALPMLQ